MAAHGDPSLAFRVPIRVGRGARGGAARLAEEGDGDMAPGLRFGRGAAEPQQPAVRDFKHF